MQVFDEESMQLRISEWWWMGAPELQNHLKISSKEWVAEVLILLVESDQGQMGHSSQC